MPENVVILGKHYRLSAVTPYRQTTNANWSHSFFSLRKHSIALTYKALQKQSK